MSTIKTSTLPSEREAIRLKGWSLRSAAAVLGVDFSHLHRVLTGERDSRSLLARVQKLPRKKIPLRKHRPNNNQTPP